MTPPGVYKTLKVSPETHARVHELANRLNGSADEAIAYLLGRSTVCVPLSAIQRERWKTAADEAGVALPEFVKMRVEAALQYDGDLSALWLIRDQLRVIARTLGAPVQRDPSTTTSTQGVPPSPGGTPQ